MEKRGQVTTFAILGVVILITISIVFIVISSRNKTVESEISASNIDEVRRQVNLDVKLCFESIVENGILNGARHGGDVILMNQLSTSEVGGSGLSDPCSMVPTATQEIKLLYGVKTQFTPEGECLVIDHSGKAVDLTDSSINLFGVEFDFEAKEVLTNPNLADFQNDLENYIRNKLPTCLREFKKYNDKGWKIEADKIETTSWELSDGLQKYLEQHDTSPDEAITLNPTPQNCPLDGRLVATLEMPLKFSRAKSVSGEEESFVLDKQEFIYNVDISYFYRKAKELYEEFKNTFGVPPSGRILDLAVQNICTACGQIDSILNKFANDPSTGVETQCAVKNGCHFYKATDPNTGAYFFNIKCGEYFFTPDGASKGVNNNANEIKVENLQGEVGKQTAEVTVDGVQNTVEEGSTMNIGGLDITFDGLKGTEVRLIVGKSVSYLWGYYFGCFPGSPTILGSGMCFIECPGIGAGTESCRNMP